MNRVGTYLQAHKRVRASALAVSILVASIALCLGVASYAWTFGPKAGQDYIRDRLVAVCLIVLAMFATVCTASILSWRVGDFLLSLVASVLITIGGSILVFGLIVAHGILAK